MAAISYGSNVSNVFFQITQLETFRLVSNYTNSINEKLKQKQKKKQKDFL